MRLLGLKRTFFAGGGPVGDLQHRKIMGVVPLGPLQDKARLGEDGGLPHKKHAPLPGIAKAFWPVA